ncbi:MAG: 5'/3'-nucleotidase SurE, partial [Duncaniella sp.]|nr:5'/3'-nucleotidase SurE [Duncaniella sp.]
MNQRPLIFITNDDGYQAPGIAHLAEAASRFGDVIVAAPLTPQSGKSSALTVNEPLELKKQAPIGPVQVYSVNGTPVDCVKIAMHAILDRQPDILLSGINHGSNAAVNNIYSGTMGATMEG